VAKGKVTMECVSQGENLKNKGKFTKKMFVKALRRPKVKMHLKI